jgi:hypothetical protein
MQTLLIGAFTLVLLVVGVVAIVNPRGVRLFGERFGGRSWFSDHTVERSIRLSGFLSLLMAMVLFALLLSGRQ